MSTDRKPTDAELVLEKIDQLQAFLRSMVEDAELVQEDARALYALMKGPEWPMHSPSHIHGLCLDIMRSTHGAAFAIDQLETLKKLLEGDYFIEGALDVHSGFDDAIDALGLFRGLATGVNARSEKA